MNVLLGVPYVAIILCCKFLFMGRETMARSVMSRTMHSNTATVVLMSWDRWEKSIATAETLPCNSEESIPVTKRGSPVTPLSSLFNSCICQTSVQIERASLCSYYRRLWLVCSHWNYYWEKQCRLIVSKMQQGREVGAISIFKLGEPDWSIAYIC